MKIIGITGGVGSGKSAVLDFLQETCNCRILKADEAAMALEEPGGICYEPVVRLLTEAEESGDGVLLPEPGKPFDRREAARRMYRSPELRRKIDAIVHPAVIRKIRGEMEKAENSGRYDYFFLEAALLIENGFLNLVDEMWYIYCSEPVRRARLKASRGYTDDKINAIMASQLSESEFRANCQVVIDNSGTPEEMHRQVRAILK